MLNSTLGHARREGHSRQFGFVGFRSVADAQAAVKYFNRSFMGAQRLAVEFAKKCAAAVFLLL
jgi:multiple RNA-binding domain-containing protein 1